MISDKEIEVEPFLEYCSEKSCFIPSTFQRIKGVIRAKPEGKKLALAIFGTFDRNGALAAYHGMAYSDYKTSFFHSVYKNYELIGALTSNSSQLDAIIKVVNSILVREKKLDALFLIAHGSATRFGIEKFPEGRFLTGEDFSSDLFGKMSEDGLIMTQACCSGEDQPLGFARQLSEKVGGRIVIAPQDDSYNSFYKRETIFPFFFHISEPREEGATYFKDGKCIAHLRSKL